MNHSIKIDDIKEKLFKIYPNTKISNYDLENIIRILAESLGLVCVKYENNIENLENQIKEKNKLIDLLKKKLNDKNQLGNIETKYDPNCSCLYCKIITFKIKLENLISNIDIISNKYSKSKNYNSILTFFNFRILTEVQNEIYKFNTEVIIDNFIDSKIHIEHKEFLNVNKSIEKLCILTNNIFIKRYDEYESKNNLNLVKLQHIYDFQGNTFLEMKNFIEDEISKESNIVKLVNLSKIEKRIISKKNNDLILYYRNYVKRLKKK